MRKKLKILPCLLLAITAISFSGCTSKPSSSVNESSQGDQKLFTIRVATQTSFNETNIADNLGYFKENGIRIEYTGVVKPPVTEFQLVAQGVNDAFVGSHPDGVAKARLAGIKLKIVTPGMVDNPKFPHVRYLVKDNSPIKSLKDINGKKVAISNTGSCTDGYIKYYFKNNNIEDKVNWVSLPNPGQMEQALTQGLVDVTTSHPPYAGLAVKAGGVREIGTSWDILQSPGAGLSCRGFSDKFISEHPDVVRGFAAAMTKARKWINSHQEEAKVIIGKRLNLKPQDLSVFWYDEENNINPAYVEKWFEISEDLGYWKRGDIKPTDIYTNEFAPK